jgi:NosR/NirI family transcriptional regulator, nitrous oxide reductase regulator
MRSLSDSANKKPLNRQRQVLLGSVVLALAAWLFGYFSSTSDLLPVVPEIVPQAVRVEKQGNIYLAYDDRGEIVGYAAIGQQQGYSGPIEMLVGMDLQGAITGVKIIAQHETPGFFKLITGVRVCRAIRRPFLPGPSANQ